MTTVQIATVTITKAADYQPVATIHEPLNRSTREYSCNTPSSHSRYAPSLSHWLSHSASFTPLYGGSVTMRSMLSLSSVGSISRQSPLYSVTVIRHPGAFVRNPSSRYIIPYIDYKIQQSRSWLGSLNHRASYFQYFLLTMALICCGQTP